MGSLFATYSQQDSNNVKQDLTDLIFRFNGLLTELDKRFEVIENDFQKQSIPAHNTGVIIPEKIEMSEEARDYLSARIVAIKLSIDGIISFLSEIDSKLPYPK